MGGVFVTPCSMAKVAQTEAPTWIASRLLLYPLKQRGTDNVSIAPKSAKVIEHPASRGEAILDDDGYCLIEPGAYDLMYIRHGLFRFGRILKLAIWFRVVSMGPAFEKTLPRFYNVKTVKKGGNFTVARHSAFMHEFLTLFPQRLKRNDRLPIKSNFRGVIISGKVRTVTKNQQQRPLNDVLQYSVLEQLTEVKGP